MLTVNWEHIIFAQSGYFGTSRRIAKTREAGAQFAPPYREEHRVILAQKRGTGARQNARVGALKEIQL